MGKIVFSTLTRIVKSRRCSGQIGAMADYAEWRDLEREFRELCHKRPVIRASETPDGWIVRSRKVERFMALAGIAALNASGRSSTWNHWLDLLKIWLLETCSDFIECSHVVSAGGIEARIPAAAKSIYHPKWPKIYADDRRLKQYTLCTIRSVCEASADYCLELARSSLRPRTRQSSEGIPRNERSREERLQAFPGSRVVRQSRHFVGRRQWRGAICTSGVRKYHPIPP